jgi:hypothetical protein
MLDQAPFATEEGRNALSGWVSACKQERTRLRSYVDTGFSNLERFITKQTGE